MDLKVYPSGEAEVYVNGRRVCKGKVGAKPGQKGYSEALDYVLTWGADKIIVDIDRYKEYYASHG